MSDCWGEGHRIVIDCGHFLESIPALPTQGVNGSDSPIGDKQTHINIGGVKVKDIPSNRIETKPPIA